MKKTKLDRKDVIIIGLVVAILCSVGFIGCTQYQNMRAENSVRVQNAYDDGVRDGVDSVILEIINQLNTTGYVTLNIGGRVLFLQPVTPS